MEFCTAKNCKNDSETLQKLQNGKNLCKLTKVLDFDRLQGKVPEGLCHPAVHANFLQYHLDTTPQPCYSLTIKSVEEEKYRSISAQRAWRLV